MKILCLTFAVCAGFLAASCSEKPGADSGGNSKPPKEKPRQDFAAAEAKKNGPSDSASESEGAPKKEEAEEVVPEPDEIGEDCVAFLRATKAVPAHPKSTECPTCPGNNATVEVLRFENFKIGKVAFTGATTCEVAVEIHAQFNPSQGGNIVGGLTGWISPEQRKGYADGKTPSGLQVYKVKVTYQRTDGRWRANEFDRGE